MPLQRILHVDYHVPSHVRLSEECRDLLTRILTADPAKRITIDGIYDHKWVGVHAQLNQRVIGLGL